MTRALRAISPFGPIFGKELRIASRRRRNHWLRVAYLGGLLLILLIVHANVGSWSGGGITARAARQAQLGAAFFTAFSIFSLIAMLLIGPVLTSTAIGGERQGKTLHVLLMTPMNSWQIVGGKLLSRMLLALILIGLSLPVLALVRLLGGVELWQMGAAIAVATSAGLFAAAIGTWLSSVMTRAFGVILASYFLLGILYMFLPMMAAFAFRSSFVAGGGGWLLYLFSLTNPFMATMLVNQGGGGIPFSVAPWWQTVLFHLAGAGVLVALTAAAIRRQQRREGEIDSRLKNVGYQLEPMSAPEADNAPPVEAPLPRGGAGRPRRLREVGDNPILWREIRQRVVQRPWLRITVWTIIILVLGGIYLSLGGLETLDDPESHIFFGNLYNVVLWLFVAVFAATRVSQEKETDTWTLLLTTPLTGRKIVWGKIFGVLWGVKLGIVLVIVHFLLCWLSGVLKLSSILLTIWTTLAFNSIWLATGLYLSLKLKNSTVAVVLNLLLAVLCYLILPMCEVLTYETVNARHDGPYLFLLVPYTYITVSIGEFSAQYWWGFGNEVELPGAGDVSSSTFIGMTLIVGALYLFVTLALLRWMSRRFDHMVGRAEQTA